LSRVFRHYSLALLLIFFAVTAAAVNTARASGRVVLLFGFAWEGDSAAATLERSVRFAASRTDLSLMIEAVRSESAYECAVACDSLMRDESVQLIVFAGDEGAAAVVALKSAAFHVPVLKLTSDPRSFATISNYVFEFLPSGESQGRILGDYAARNLMLQGAVILAPQDARGRAVAEGFTKGFGDAGRQVDAERLYSTDAVSIRPDFDAVMADTARFGYGRDVLYADSSIRGIAAEGLFFTLSRDRIESCAKQIGTLPDNVILLGNSSWMDLDALSEQRAMTTGMYMVLPLMPEPLDTTGLVAGYRQMGAAVNEWALLGLDAGTLVGRIMATRPRSQQDVVRALANAPRMTGVATIVDFRNGHQSTAARVVRYENDGLHVVK
jgi:ABC-type branched-subunit amino acid transport system substrate-binding protein